MEGYGYPYGPPFPQMRGPDGEYPDHGDGYGEYFGLGPLNEDVTRRPSTSKYRDRKPRGKRTRSRVSTTRVRSRSHSKTRTKSRSRSRSKTRTISRSPSRSRSRGHSGSRSHSSSRRRELNLKEPSFLDAFRVMYLTPSKHRKSTTIYLTTKKRQDKIQELLKNDGLGSKKWLFYPRVNHISEPHTGEVPGTRDNIDRRVKIDGEFFRKYKRSKKVDTDAPIAKLKRWELMFYKKIGFVQAV